MIYEDWTKEHIKFPRITTKSVNNIIMDAKKIHYQKKGNTNNVRY